MAISYYFFDAQLVSGAYDRTYSAGDFASYLNKLVGNGVFPNPSTSMQVSAGTGFQVVVGAGEGWIDGHKIVNDADMILTVDQADVTLDRIDRVIMYCDMVNREMGIKIKKGTNASKPTAPALTRTQNLKEYCLATYTVPHQSTGITVDRITDTRLDSSVCGMVQGLIQQVDTATLYQQWNAGYAKAIEDNQELFDTWFDNVKDTLSTSTLIRTYRQREELQAAANTANINIAQYVKELDILEIYVNGFRLDTMEYTVNDAGTAVTFTNQLDAGAVIEFVIYKTVDGSDAETAVGQIAALQTEVSELDTTVTNMQNYFRSPTKLYSTALSPDDSSGTVKYANVANLSSYDIIILRCSLGASTRTQDLIFFVGSGTGVLSQFLSAYANATYNALATVTVDTNNNRVGVACTYLAGWQLSSVAIREVYGIKL